MRSTMLSSPRSAPKRYKGEDDDFEDEDFEDEVDEVTFPEFRLGGKISNHVFVGWRRGRRLCLQGLREVVQVARGTDEAHRPLDRLQGGLRRRVRGHEEGDQEVDPGQ